MRTLILDFNKYIDITLGQNVFHVDKAITSCFGYLLRHKTNSWNERLSYGNFLKTNQVGLGDFVCVYEEITLTFNNLTCIPHIRYKKVV